MMINLFFNVEEVEVIEATQSKLRYQPGGREEGRMGKHESWFIYVMSGDFVICLMFCSENHQDTMINKRLTPVGFIICPGFRNTQ